MSILNNPAGTQGAHSPDLTALAGHLDRARDALTGLDAAPRPRDPRTRTDIRLAELAAAAAADFLAAALAARTAPAAVVHLRAAATSLLRAASTDDTP